MFIANLTPTPTIEKSLQEIISETQIDYSWSFSDKKRRDTTYITHGYHSYPAKFIPQVAGRLIAQYSQAGDLILDPFAGCGTSLVEAKVTGRRSIGTDINPTATLITQAKLNALDPLLLEQTFIELKNRFGLYTDNFILHTHNHERINYWFRPEEKSKLSFLYHHIKNLTDKPIQTFFWCAFSNILKSCSIWMQKSNKPTRDPKKKPADPFIAFQKQVRAMLRGNAEYYALLQQHGYLDLTAQICQQDARQAPTENETVQLVVTSPPYVTSYEYADLHQLSTLWLKYAEDLVEFRKQFIGTAYNPKSDLEMHSSIAEYTVEQMRQKHKKSAEEIATYFGEMYQVWAEMHRVLQKGGKICIVIGNTALLKVDILNAEVFAEQLQSLGFGLTDIIKREIPSKNLPSVRDEISGRFAKTTDSNITYAYPTEYILVMEKQ